MQSLIEVLSAVAEHPVSHSIILNDTEILHIGIRIIMQLDPVETRL